MNETEFITALTIVGLLIATPLLAGWWVWSKLSPNAPTREDAVFPCFGLIAIGSVLGLATAGTTFAAYAWAVAITAGAYLALTQMD